MKLFLQLLANGLVNGALFAMMAVGFGMAWRSLNIFHIAYGGFYVVLTYIFYSWAVLAGTPMWLGFGLTLTCAAILGWLAEVGFYRWFYHKNASSGAVLIASLGLFVMLENLLVMGFGNELRSIPRPLSPLYEFGPVNLTELQLIQFSTGILSISALWLLVWRLRVFKALWAMGDQPQLISALGLPLYQLRVLAMVVSTVMLAIPACLISLDLGMTPHSGMSYLLIAAVAVLVGGKNSYRGWVMGALVLAILQSLAVWQWSARWMDLVTFSLLVLMLVFRSRGLLENATRPEESA